jgi:hypothetical protein
MVLWGDVGCCVLRALGEQRKTVVLRPQHAVCLFAFRPDSAGIVACCALLSLFNNLLSVRVASLLLLLPKLLRCF